MTVDIIVVGAGALGAATAAELARRGASVRLMAPQETSASARAAGMLAPAFESVLDEPMAAHGALLKAARDLWPALAEAAGVVLHREGAEWRGADARGVAQRLTAAGFAAETHDRTVFTPDDWRLEPDQALAALGGRLERIDRRLVGLRRRGEGFELKTDGGEVATAAQVVLASGWVGSEAVGPLPPIKPIKGQAVRLAGPSVSRVIRAEGVYVAPTSGGSIVGATMETGVADLEVDAAVIAGLMARAFEAAPEIAGSTAAEPYAAVRGASIDGLPYAGLIGPGLAVALAPRRNGWLLAPMVARTVADALERRGPDAAAEAMDPGRVSPDL